MLTQSTYGQLADALHLISETLLDIPEPRARFDRLFGEQLRPLHEALVKYFRELDAGAVHPVGPHESRASVAEELEEPAE